MAKREFSVLFLRQMIDSQAYCCGEDFAVLKRVVFKHLALVGSDSLKTKSREYSVVVWSLCVYSHGWVGKCSEILTA